MRSRSMWYLTAIGVAGLLAVNPAVPGQCDLGKITASDPAGGDDLGASGYDASLDGTVTLIGARDATGNAYSSGAAYVFRLADGTWSQEAKLVASDGASFAYFGYAVDIAGDIAVVGDYKHDTYRGAVYIFLRDEDTGEWAQHQMLTPAPDVGDSFGFSAGVSGDLIVGGTPGDDDSGSNYGGAAYVFRRNGASGLWEQEAKLLASDGGNVDWFGMDVDVEGNHVVVGASRKHNMQGAVYVYYHDGDIWAQEQKLMASDGVSEDHFGKNVALSGAGLLIGAYANDDQGDASGSAYVFRYDADAHWWSEEQKLLPGDGAGQDYFGSDVALSGDFAIVGAPGDDDGATDAGSAYIFAYQGESAGWQQVDKLTAALPDTTDAFGASVAAHAWIGMICAPGDDDAAADAGAAYCRGGFSDNDCNENGAPDECDIADGTSEDTNGNGIPDECEPSGDLDGDGDVDLGDLAQLLSNYGMTSGATYEDGDLDGDGDVDLADLAALLANYGTGT